MWLFPCMTNLPTRTMTTLQSSSKIFHYWHEKPITTCRHMLNATIKQIHNRHQFSLHFLLVAAKKGTTFHKNRMLVLYGVTPQPSPDDPSSRVPQNMADLPLTHCYHPKQAKLDARWCHRQAKLEQSRDWCEQLISHSRVLREDPGGEQRQITGS